MPDGMTITGLRDMQVKLLLLGDKVYNRHLTAAVRAGTKPIVAAARAKVPVDTGMLKKSLGNVIRQYRRKQTVISVIGPRQGFALVNETQVVHDPARFGHAVETGHGGPAPAAARPFLRPALDEEKGAAMSALRSRLAEGIDIEARKHG